MDFQKEFEHSFDLAERFGYNDVTMKTIDGRSHVLLNDGMRPDQAIGYMEGLRKLGHSAWMQLNYEGYGVYYCKAGEQE
jgi:hypothetical protein